MERFIKTAAWLGQFAFAVLIGYGVRSCSVRPITLASQSPDYKWRVYLVERPRMIDRNFEIEMEDIKSKNKRTVFRSPDEGAPGSERMIWSLDASRVLLLGGKFFVTEGATISTGEQLYLMMDIATGKIWCNASQQNRHPSFGLEDVGAISWLGWTPPPNQPLRPARADGKGS